MSDLVLDRREFVIAGSAGLLSLACAGASADITTGLSVGYWSGNDSGRLGAPLSCGRIGESALVTVHGMRGQAAMDLVALTALFVVDHDGVERSVPYHAWVAHSGRGHVSSPVRFVMPVHPKYGLIMTVKHGDADGKLVESPVRFTATAAAPGTYLIVLPEGSESVRPNWRALRFRGDSDDSPAQNRQLVRQTIHGDVSVDFGYLVVSIADAKPAA